MTTIAAMLIMALGLLVAQPDQALVIPSGARIEGDVATVAEDIRVDGEVIGDVTSWSGNIVIAGRVDGDVVSYTGTVTVLPEARVEGSTLALAGEVQIADAAAVAGLVFKGSGQGGALTRLVGLFGVAPGQVSGIAPVARVLFGITLGALMLAFCLMLIGLWPHRTAAAGRLLARHPLASLLIGPLTALALVLLLPVITALLAITLIGLPLAVIVLALAHIPFLYGLAALAQAGRSSIERRLSGAPQLTHTTALIATALVTPVALLAMVWPIAALLLFYLMASPGLGAALLSRGGIIAPPAPSA